MIQKTQIQKSWRIFIIGSGCILVTTGLAKLITLTGDTSLLLAKDPIFGIEFSLLMLAVGLGEIAVAAVCMFSRREMLSTIFIASIASAFLVYRAGARMVDWERPCGCLGNLTDVLGISPEIAKWTSMGLLGFLFLGSYGFLFLCIKRAELVWPKEETVSTATSSR